MDKSYLNPEFDPSSLKVAALRGILLDNGVSYPSNAKKKELLRLFEENVAGTSAPDNSLGSEDETEIETETESNAQAIKTIVEEDRKPKKSKSKKKTAKSTEKPEKREKLEKKEKKSKKKKKTKTEQDESTLKPESTHSSLQEASKTTSQTETPKASKISKRKFTETSETPSKGNIFMVDTDSDIDVSSPMQKKRKAIFNEEIDVSPTLPRLSASEKTATPESKTVSAVESNSPKASADNSRVEASEHASTQSPVSDVQTPRKTHFSGSEDATETSEINNTFVQRNRLAASANTSKIETPTLHRIEDSGYSTDSESVGTSKKESKKETLSESLSNLQNDLSKDSHSFDNALAKLKKDNTPVKSASPRDAELAKLLGVDISGVKPKPKGKRKITPRRQIVIPESRLNQKSDLSSSGLSSDASSDEEEVDLAIFGSDASEISSEAESENESDFDTSITKNTSRLPLILRAFFYFFLWTIVVGGLLFGYWYREQTILVGYCGQEVHQRTVPATPDTSEALIQFGAYLDENFKPSCVECPQHARCFSKLELACYDDFVVRSPWYFPYLPFFNPRAQRCVPDTKKAEKIEIIMGVALELLRARNANRNCGQSSTEDLSAGIGFEELHDLLLQLKAPYITVEEFEELWERSVEELQKEPEIIVRQVTLFEREFPEPHTNTQVGYANHHVAGVDANNTVGETALKDKVFRSTSLSHISAKCMMSNTLLAVAVRFKRALIILALFVAVSCFAYYKYQEQKLYTQQVDTLYTEVLRKLQRQAKLARGSTELPEYVGSIQLRDLILSSESNLSRKMRFWEAVSRKVDRNTNVKHELLEVHGEVMKVWRWISSLEDESL